MSKFGDLELEQSLLLACIENNENIDTLSSIVNSNDFSYKLHAEIFEFLVSKKRLNESVDLKQLINYFPNAKENFWQSLQLQNSFIDVYSYAKTLRDLSIKDQLDSIAKNTLVELLNVQDSVEYTMNLNSKIYNVLSGVSNNTLKSSTQAINEFLSEYNRVSQILDKDIIGVDTGFSLLNYHTKGFKPGELIIIAARPGMGKTTLALNITLNALKKDVGVVFYSLEMQAHQLMSKLIASDTGINLQDLLTANIIDSDFERLQVSASFLSSKTFYIYDRGELNIEMLRSSLKRLKEEHKNIGLCVIDYIGLMSSLNSKADRHLQVSEISRNLKMLALELKMPIIALSQVNRAVDARSNKRLILSDIRESGSIEQDADLILFVNQADDNPEIHAERHAIIDIAKNRSGALAEMHFDFKASKSRFEQLDFSSFKPSESEEY